MEQYCEKCGTQIVISAKYCPECGERMSAAAEGGACVQAANEAEMSAPRDSGGIRFNFSKPLSLVFALIMLATFFFPWMRANAVLNGIAIQKNGGVNIFALPSFIKKCINSFTMIAGPGAELTDAGERLVSMLNILLMLITTVFLLIAVHFVLFGIVGLFSSGKLRYYFARVGGTLYLIALLLFIGLVFLGNAALGALSRQSTADGSMELALSVAPTAYVYAAAVLALVFRVFGIRALRRLNAESCLNRGKYEIAAREIELIGREELLSRIPKTHSERASGAE